MRIRRVCLAVMTGALLLAGCANVTEVSVSTESERESRKETIVSDEVFFQKLHETMSSEAFFELMVEFLKTEDVEPIVAGLNGEACVYSAEDGFVSDYTGIAVGLYPGDEGDYYFYIGEYVNGSREGENKSLHVSDSAFYVFDGNWANDKPNGKGSVTQYTRGEDGSYSQTYMFSKSGNFVDGIEDGEFSCTFINLQDYTILTGSYTATAGVAMDVWDQYPQYHDREDFKETHESGKRILVVCLDETGNNMIWLSQDNPEEKLAVPGFGVDE